MVLSSYENYFFLAKLLTVWSGNTGAVSSQMPDWQDRHPFPLGLRVKNPATLSRLPSWMTLRPTPFIIRGSPPRLNRFGKRLRRSPGGRIRGESIQQPHQLFAVLQPTTLDWQFAAWW